MLYDSCDNRSDPAFKRVIIREIDVQEQVEVFLTNGQPV